MKSLKLSIAAGVAAFFYAAAAQAGIEAYCESPSQALGLQTEITNYASSLGAQAFISSTSVGNKVTLTLNAPYSEKPTYRLKTFSQLKLNYETVVLPLPPKQDVAIVKPTKVNTVGKKEIFLALAHPARKTTLPGCSVKALSEHVELRQHIVAWTENLQFVWPEGEPAFWNESLWEKGTPLNLSKTHEALLDAFQYPQKYSVGCYTAAKMVYAHAILDFYQRVKKDNEKANLVKERLLRDSDPLVDIEPPRMWESYPEYDYKDHDVSGKLLRLEDDVSEKSIVPGDWIYMLNPDPVSFKKTGYEGSNAIYAGLDRFASYYDPTGDRYTTVEKVNDVYQWRHGVFDRPRDLHKEEKVSAEFLESLLAPLGKGGMLVPIRAVPYFFGYESIPQ